MLVPSRLGIGSLLQLLRTQSKTCISSGGWNGLQRAWLPASTVVGASHSASGNSLISDLGY